MNIHRCSGFPGMVYTIGIDLRLSRLSKKSGGVVWRIRIAIYILLK